MRDDASRTDMHRRVLLDLALSLRRPSPTLDEDLRRITEVGATALQVHRASVWLLEDDGSALVCADLFDAETLEHRSGARLDASAYPAYLRACRESRTIDADDALSDPRTSELAGYLRQHGIVSLLDAPIFVGGRTLGVVCLEHRGEAPRAWHEDERVAVSSLADLTSLSMVAHEQARRERLYRSAIDDQADVLIRVSRSGEILLANRAAGDMYGAEASALEGRNVLEFAPPEQHDLVRAAAARLSPARPLTRYAHPVVVDGRELAVLEWTLRGFFSGEGRLLGYQAIGRDVTAERMREQRLREAQRLESLAVFSGGMAHDLNNLLTPILLHADVAVAQLPEGGERAAMQEVVRAALRARDLVRQVLSVSEQADADVRDTVDVVPLVREAVGFVQASAPPGIRFDVHIDEDCGSLRAGPSDLFRVVSNLCSNAVQAMGESGTLTVRVRCDDGDDGALLVLEVCDDGPGIDAATRARIFDPLFTTKDEGTGLGLAIVRGTVDRLGGTIDVCTTIGQGTTFSVVLPSNGRDLGGADRPGALSGRERVVVVDDDPAILCAVEGSLAGLGYAVRTFSSALDALDALAPGAEDVDVVVTDVVMPRIGGRELARRLQAVRPDLPVVLMSTSPPEDLGEDVAGFVPKPFRIEELALAIRAALAE